MNDLSPFDATNAKTEEASLERTRLDLDRYRAETERYRAELDRYRAEVEGRYRPLFEATIRFAEMYVRSLLVLNGGAALGLLTFVSSAAARGGSGNYKPALLAFGSGAALAVLTAGFSYVAQFCYSNSSGDDWKIKIGYGVHIAAACWGTFALAAFGVGIWQAASGIP
jgi:hypothetical protein